jgi:hypothetical protein
LLWAIESKTTSSLVRIAKVPFQLEPWRLSINAYHARAQ